MFTQGKMFREDVVGRFDSGNLLIEDDARKKQYELGEIINRTIHGDAMAVLERIPKETFDAVFIDPPYYLQLPKKDLVRWKAKTVVDGVDDEWDKFSSFQEYDDYIEKLLKPVQRVMKPNATIWVISTYHSVFRIGRIMQDLGFWILNDVIWVKTNPMPNWLGVRFTNATENLIWAVKHKDAKKYTFHKDVAKKFGIGSVGANVWVLPICTGSQRLKNDNGQKLHSTQKPIELLKRVILVSTNEGDLILDPVAGTGTTGYVASALRRDFVMIERNAKYIEGMVHRFEKPLHLGTEPVPSSQKAERYIPLEDTG